MHEELEHTFQSWYNGLILRKTCKTLKLFEFIRREERWGAQVAAPPLPLILFFFNCIYIYITKTLICSTQARVFGRLFELGIFLSPKFESFNKLEGLELFLEDEVKTNTEESNWFRLQDMHEALEHNSQL